MMEEEKNSQEMIESYLDTVEQAMESACFTLEEMRIRCGGMFVHRVNNLYQVLVNQKYFIREVSKLSSQHTRPEKSIDEKMLNASLEVAECLSLLRKILKDGIISDREYKRFKKESGEAIQSLGFLIDEVETFYKKQEKTK